ncbi:MAG TPA: magnesium transporter [Fibrobacteria bacterium]|nr:magnesium transporter [Fibrobacteria bacterium]
MASSNLQTRLLYPDLEAALETGDLEALQELCDSLAAEDLAEMVEQLEPLMQAIFFEQVPEGKATEIFQLLEVNLQKEILNSVSNQRVAAIINQMDPDDRTALLETMPQNATRQLLSFLKPRERKQAQRLLDFPKDSIGRLMTPDFLAIKQEWTVERVLDFIRRNGEDKETLNDIYVVDDKGRLIDEIGIREFLLSPLDRPTLDIMDRQFVSLPAHHPEEEAIQAFKKYSSRTALPVTDEEGYLLGIVTIDDILHLEEKETTEDIHKLGGVGALEEAYLDSALISMVKKRGGWLVILFVGEMLTATAMSFFEKEISRAVVLALFIPLIISSGGNAGSQAASLIIRAIALGEVRFQDWWTVMRREIFVGLILGGALGLIGLLRISVFSAFFGTYGNHWFLLALTVCFSLIGVVAWGTLIGSLFPILLKRLGADPATSSAPFVATFIDVTGIVIYFNIALLLLHGKLL